MMAGTSDFSDPRREEVTRLMQRGRWQEARSLCSAICNDRHDDADAWFVLGMINGQLSRWEDSISCWRRVLSLRPDHVDSHFNLGQALIVQGRFEEAVSHMREVVRLRPGFAEAHFGLGFALHRVNRLEEAVECFRRSLSLQPNAPQVHNNLGMALKNQSRLGEAEASFREALRQQPGYAVAHSNLLFSLNYMPRDPATLFAEHCAWAQRQAGSIRRDAEHRNFPDPDRRLRIGYVSPDYRNHSVAFFLFSLLMHHDPGLVEVFCYADVARPDEFTARFRATPHAWRDIHRLTDAQVADLVRQDGIDILVDLAGHTAKNRLLVFARQPAPIQVSYLGYPNTTGLATMDYRFTDAEADPPGQTERLHTERLVRLPRGFLCYGPPDTTPSVSPLPAAATGMITFGSFNHFAKIGPPVIEQWARLLHQVPGSRLIMKNRSFADALTRERGVAQFTRHGVAPERLELVGYLPDTGDHLMLYRRIDIALDTFPYHGTTTTCEALWMGVPVVTLAGRQHAGRVGVSLLTRVGLPELIADNEDDYVWRAVELVSDRDRLAQLRQTLRARMQASPLCDGHAFARDVEAAYREMWRGWCVVQSAGE